jgi:hypothetical protein
MRGLLAWEKLLTSQGYNGFYIRSDIATGKFVPLTSSAAFEANLILSKVP